MSPLVAFEIRVYYNGCIAVEKFECLYCDNIRGGLALRHLLIKVLMVREPYGEKERDMAV